MKPCPSLPARYADPALGPSNDARRRALLHGAGLWALGAACGGAVALPAWAAVEGTQRRWRFCGKCSVMHYDDPRRPGRCAADGGAHAALGHLFKIDYSDARRQTPPVAKQYDWRFCGKCHAMFFSNPRHAGRCAGGGAHAATGFMFGLQHKGAGTVGQDAWRFCAKCHALFFDGAPNKGRCATGGAHAAQGIVFSIPFDVAASTPVGVSTRAGRHRGD